MSVTYTSETKKRAASDAKIIIIICVLDMLPLVPHTRMATIAATCPEYTIDIVTAIHAVRSNFRPEKHADEGDGGELVYIR